MPETITASEEAILFDHLQSGLKLFNQSCRLDANRAVQQTQLFDRFREINTSGDRLEVIDDVPFDLRPALSVQALEASLTAYALESAEKDLELLRETALQRFAGRIITVRAVSEGTQSITEYAYKSGAFGPHDWAQRELKPHPKTATGSILDIAPDLGRIRVTPSRRRDFWRRMDKTYWDVVALDHAGNQLVSIEFIDKK